MKKTLRRESLRCVLPRIVLCGLLALILLGVSGGGLLKLMSGATPLSELSREELEGQYVSFDASQVIVAFANLTSSNSDGDSKTLKTYYLLPFGDSYMAVMVRGEDYEGLMERAMEQSHEYYLGDLDTLTGLGTIRGTVGPLEEDMSGYMTDCIDNYQLPGYLEGEDSSALLVPYQVKLDYVGPMKKPLTLALGLAGASLLLLALLQLAVVMAGCYQKKALAVTGEAEEDFQSAEKIERVRVGRYLWYTKGPGSRAVPVESLVWGYALPEPLVVSKYRWPVALYNRERQLLQVCFMEQSHCQDFLKAVAAQGHPFLSGYTSDLSWKFQEDFEGFLREAEQAGGTL